VWQRISDSENKMSMNVRIAMALLALVASGVSVSSQQVKIAPDQHYLILEIVRVATFAEELNDAAKQGFRLKMSAANEARVTALMERTATLPDVFQYRIVSTFTSKSGDKDMNAAAAEGFRVVPHTFMVKKGLTIFNVDNVVVMEKEPKPTTTYEYKTIGAIKTSTFEMDLKNALADKWQVFDMVYGQLLLERLKL
jgi:hypothetical protein